MRPSRHADILACRGGMASARRAAPAGSSYGRIVGRSKDRIIRGGENIYPRELEEFFFQHDAIEDVQVVGVPDEKFGEEVCACIRLRAGMDVTEQAMIDYCRGQIAHFKVPRYIYYLDTFPMTVTGKVQKHLLRDMAAVALRERT